MFIGGGYYSAGFTSIGQDPYGNYRQGQDTGQLTELLTKILGKHELKFGFEGRLHQQNYIQTNAPLGYFNFNSLGSSQCPVPDITQCGGDDMASFMMGQMMGAGGYYENQFRTGDGKLSIRRICPRQLEGHAPTDFEFGTSLGCFASRMDRHNRQNWFDPNAVSPLNGGNISYVDPITQQAVTSALLGGEVFTNASTRTNWQTDWKDIQPRFGFAYLADKKTVIRGGYGIYFDQTRSGANGLLSYGS